MFCQWYKLRIDFLHDILYAHEIFLRGFHFAKCLALPRLVLRDTCCFLEKSTPLLGTAVQDVIHAILPDDAHALMADSRIRKELIHVFDAAARMIDIGFTFTAAKKSPRHDNLLVRNGQCSIRIIKNERYLGHIERLTRTASRKNDILSFRRTQISCILFTKNPADGICDIAFSTAIRANNRRNAAMKNNFCLFSKRFESIGFQALQLHILLSVPFLFIFV